MSTSAARSVNDVTLSAPRSEAVKLVAITAIVSRPVALAGAVDRAGNDDALRVNFDLTLRLKGNLDPRFDLHFSDVTMHSPDSPVLAYHPVGSGVINVARHGFDDRRLRKRSLTDSVHGRHAKIVCYGRVKIGTSQTSLGPGVFGIHRRA